ncbi:unnamed protein product, partial [Nesidiocoris tenuis]
MSATCMDQGQEPQQFTCSTISFHSRPRFHQIRMPEHIGNRYLISTSTNPFPTLVTFNVNGIISNP